MFTKTTITYNSGIKSTIITAKIPMWDNFPLVFNVKESLFLRNLQHNNNNRKVQIKMNNSRGNNNCECCCDGKTLN